MISYWREVISSLGETLTPRRRGLRKLHAFLFKGKKKTGGVWGKTEKDEREIKKCYVYGNEKRGTKRENGTSKAWNENLGEAVTEKRKQDTWSLGRRKSFFWPFKAKRGNNLFRGGHLLV